jgi:Tfp pilus assembly PilM family ATPase
MVLKMSLLWEKFIEFFTTPPGLFSGFSIASHYICGVHLSTKEKSIVDFYAKGIPEGVVQSSFIEKNIVEPEVLKSEFLKAVRSMRMNSKDIALIFPELSQKTFTFSFDSLPSTSREREQIIRFRIKKRMPFLPEDARISYDLFPRDSGIRAVVILTRTNIIKEYEEFFQQFGFNVRTAVPPSVGLVNLVDAGSEENFFLLNIEKESFSLSLYKGSEFILYRQKRFDFEKGGTGSLQEKMEDVFEEVEKTLNFAAEGLDRREIKFWIRSGIGGPDGFIEKAEKKLGCSFQKIGSSLNVGLNPEETDRLSPVLGVLL